jgi:hypothetical protein
LQKIVGRKIFFCEMKIFRKKRNLVRLKIKAAVVGKP